MGMIFTVLQEIYYLVEIHFKNEGKMKKFQTDQNWEFATSKHKVREVLSADLRWKVRYAKE